MADKKIKKQNNIEVPVIKKDKIEIIEKKPEKEDEDDEEFESEIINQGSSSSFRYPFLRRSAPSIRIQPITQPLEVELNDLPAAKKEENNADLYKPAQFDKNYSLNQKYELSGAGSSYESVTPKTITAPAPTLGSTNFSDQMSGSRGMGQSSTTGYPGQESSEKKYDSGLEQQTKEQERRRRM